jgi:hypothetical protein
MSSPSFRVYEYSVSGVVREGMLTERTAVSWGDNIKDNAKSASSWSHSSRIEAKLTSKGFTSQEFVEWKDKNVKRIEDVFCLCDNKHRATKQLIRLMEKDRQGLSGKQGPPNPYG